MIPNRWSKLVTVLQTICQNLEGARPYDDRMLSRYLQILEIRQDAGGVGAFIDQIENLRLMFELLTIWDQYTERASVQQFQLFSSTVDSKLGMGKELLDTFDLSAKGATIKGLALFCQGIKQCRQALVAVEDATHDSTSALHRAIGTVYENLPMARSHKHIVSNAVLMHLLFPTLLMPVDGQHTLTYLYGRDTVLPTTRYTEVITFQQEVLSAALDWNVYLDDGWNTTPPKLVDNAIIFLSRMEKVEDRMRG